MAGVEMSKCRFYGLMLIAINFHETVRLASLFKFKKCCSRSCHMKENKVFRILYFHFQLIELMEWIENQFEICCYT